MYESYRETLKAVDKQLRNMPTRDENGVSNPERQHLSAAASDLRYIIEWMETGFPPLPREASRLSGEQREEPHDPNEYRFLACTAVANRPDCISEEDREKIQDVLNDRLTPREREVFVMTHAGLLSQYAVARILGISRDSVKTLLKRAEKKLEGIAEGAENIIQRSMFE